MLKQPFFASQKCKFESFYDSQLRAFIKFEDDFCIFTNFVPFSLLELLLEREQLYSFASFQSN